MAEHERSDPMTPLPGADAPVPKSWKPITSGDRVLIALIGELDLATAPSVATEVLAYVHGEPDDLVLDCSELTFIDSSGIKALLSLHHALTPQGRSIVLRNVSDVCRLPLEVSGLSELFGLDR